MSWIPHLDLDEPNPSTTLNSSHHFAAAFDVPEHVSLKSGALQGENFLTQCGRNKQLESAESLSTKLWFEHICQKMATCGCISTACWSFLGHFPGFGFLQFFQNAGSGRGMIPCLRVSSERACQGLLESGLKPKIRLTVQKLWRKHFWNFGPFWNGVDAKKFDRAQLFNQTCFCHKN